MANSALGAEDRAEEDHLEQGVGDEQHQQAAGHLVETAYTIEPAVLRADNTAGQPIYRVIHVGDGTDCEGLMATAVLQPSQVGQQAVLQSPFATASSSPHGDGMEARFTYVPAGGADGDSGGTTTVLATNPVGPVGQFYVMMSPQEVLPNQRGMATRSAAFVAGKSDSQRGVRDDRRRSTHNEGNKAAHKEVERRRRDKINNWIVALSKLIPEYMQDHPKQSPVGAVGSSSASQSKGGILAKACEYINDLRKEHMQMTERLKDFDRVNVDNELMRQQLEEVKQENALLRAQLQQHNILLESDVSHNGT